MCQVCALHGIDFHAMAAGGVEALGGFPTGFVVASAEAAFADYVTATYRWTDSGSSSGGVTTTLGAAGGVVGWSIAGAGLTNATGVSFFTGSTVNMASFLPFDYAATLKSAFDAWAAVANIDFVQLADGGGNIGTGPFPTIRISGGFIDGQSGSNVLARAFFPNPSFAAAGDIVFDSGNTTFYATPSNFLLTALHEIGHALGLNHEQISLAIMNPTINTSLAGLQIDDVNGARALYGSGVAHLPAFYMPSTQANVTLLGSVSSFSAQSALRVYGNALDNVITGSGSADYLDGGQGADQLFGGAGDDTYIVDNVGDVVTESAGSGNLLGGVDTVLSSVSFALGADVENLTLTGAANIDGSAIGDGKTLTGNSASNTLALNGYFSTLNGGGGRDRLQVTGDWNILNAGAAATVMSAAGNWNTLNGSTGDDTLWVTGGGSNSLSGGAGTDTLDYSALSAAVRLDVAGSVRAGTNADSSFTGIENFVLGQGNDHVIGASGTHMLDGGAGFDVLDYSAASVTITIDLANGRATYGTLLDDTFVNFENVVGSGGNTLVIGGNGWHALDGGGGTNTIVYAGTTVNVNLLTGQVLNNGFDARDSLSGFQNATVTSHGAILQAGSVAGVLILNGNFGFLTGQTSDTLQATGDWNTLTAGMGNSTLVTVGGYNKLYGGPGNDTLTASGGHFNILDGGAGSSTITATGDWNTLTAGDGGSLLAATGSWNTLRGGGGDDSLATGGGGSNTLDGRGGSDILTGGRGKATYVYGDGYGNDTIVDFMAGDEHYLDFRSLSSVHSVADLFSHAVQSGSDVVIAVGGESLTMRDTPLDYLIAHQDHLLLT